MESEEFSGGRSERSIRFNRLLCSRGSYLEKVSGGVPAILRTVMYDWLREEVPSVFAELCRRYGVEMDEGEWTFFPHHRY